MEEWPTTALIFAGKAVFTIKNPDNGHHYTFKIQKPTHKLPIRGIWWVLTKDYNNRWMYMFSFRYRNDGKVYAELTPNSGITTLDHPAAKAVVWFITKLNECKVPGRLILEFSNYCCRCGRQLTDVKSIQRHVGPECIKYIGTEK